MELETAIRTRRTHKAYGEEPVDRTTLDELPELARWAPNHHLTNPWRFRVLGPRTLAALKAAAGPEAAAKLDRAPTLVCVSVVQGGADPAADEEDLLAAGCATYALLLGAGLLIGGYLGAVYAVKLPGTTLRRIFGVFLLLTSIRMLYK